MTHLGYDNVIDWVGRVLVMRLGVRQLTRQHGLLQTVPRPLSLRRQHSRRQGNVTEASSTVLKGGPSCLRGYSVTGRPHGCQWKSSSELLMCSA
jgi:hypothetical protein